MTQKYSLEELRELRARQEPSNFEIVSAYSRSEHLSLFYVGNKARDKIYVLASSRNNARIIAMMGGHIRELGNAEFWKPLIGFEKGSAVDRAIRDGVPGVIWPREGGCVMRHKVYKS